MVVVVLYTEVISEVSVAVVNDVETTGTMVVCVETAVEVDVVGTTVV